MKPLKSANREKKRYLLLSGKDIDAKNIDEAILDFIGVLGYAEASPQIIKNNGKIIIAINREMLDKIRTSFLVSGKDIQIVKVSGSIKKLK